MLFALGLRGEAFFGKTNKILKLSLTFLVLFQRWKNDKTY